MEKKLALVLALMLFASTLVSAEETPTIGQRLDSATAEVSDFFNKHAIPAVNSISSSAKSIYNWFGDKAKEWGL